jgi:hypothetical protein
VIHVAILERVVIDEVHEPLETRRQTGVSHLDVRLGLWAMVDPVHLRYITFCTSARAVRWAPDVPSP